MTKRVIVIPSGETERRSLPHLVGHLNAEGISVDEVRIPPGGKALNVEMAEKLIKAAWYEQLSQPPDKFVVLVDADGKDPNEVLRPLQEQLPRRLGSAIQAAVQYAYAQWHLEAWYFADSKNLRDYLGQALGSVDTSNPDGISKPKLHLKNLLGKRVYTAVISEEIAKALDGRPLRNAAPVFRGFSMLSGMGTLPWKEAEQHEAGRPGAFAPGALPGRPPAAERRAKNRLPGVRANGSPSSA